MTEPEVQKNEKLDACLQAVQDVIDGAANMSAESLNTTVQNCVPQLAVMFKYLSQTNGDNTEFDELKEFITSFTEMMLSAPPTAAHRFTVASLRMLKKKMTQSAWSDDDLARMYLLLNVWKALQATT